MGFVVTYFELLAGCRNRREQRIVSREMRNYHLLFLTEDISRTALSWYTRFHLSHGVGFLTLCLERRLFIMPSSLQR